MTPEKEGELFANFATLITMVRGLDDRLRAVEISNGEIRGALAEQSKLLIALVPQTIAAVPGKKVG